MVAPPEVFAGAARWTTSAAPFATVVPPVVEGAWPSAVAVTAIHADVTASHAQFGARLLETATGTQLAGISYTVMDAEQNAHALGEVIGDAVQS
jgi:hypothetical protein